MFSDSVTSERQNARFFCFKREFSHCPSIFNHSVEGETLHFHPFHSVIGLTDISTSCCISDFKDDMEFCGDGP